MTDTEWQSIESAPKDGRRIVAYGIVAFESEPSVATVAWNSTYGVWYADPNEATEYSPEECKLTHWMPLPGPPK